jgi:type VI secretion system protein ImpA
MNDTMSIRVNDDAREIASAYFQAAYALPLDALLAPIVDEANPTGEDLRGSEQFRHIQEARKADDPSLPLGPWARELKRADWTMVGKASVEALVARSKDLQLAAWVLESGLHCYGLIALAPGLTLLQGLCERHWEGLFPTAPEGDLDYRTNLFRWIDNKFPALLAVLPVTQAGQAEGELSLGHWRRANLPDDEGHQDSGRQEAFLAALAATPSAFLADQEHQLSNARAALHALDGCLDALCGEQAPGLGGLSATMDEIKDLVGMELAQRGTLIDGEPVAALEDGGDHILLHQEYTGTGIARRQEAYALLAQAADYLIQTDPHSPVPYLVRQAIAWGRMDTRALYQELFLEQGGQINVFHLLGLKPEENAA